MPLGIAAGETGQRLWEAIAQGSGQGHGFTGLWAVYAAVSPKKQHTAVGKETGETAPVERWKTTLRQRRARFVHMTVSFSRLGADATPACLLLFLYRYNLDQAILYPQLPATYERERA